MATIEALSSRRLIFDSISDRELTTPDTKPPTSTYNLEKLLNKLHEFSLPTTI
jgi:hypothetical protein